jgi:hypothetical protein
MFFMEKPVERRAAHKKQKEHYRCKTAATDRNSSSRTPWSYDGATCNAESVAACAVEEYPRAPSDRRNGNDAKSDDTRGGGGFKASALVFQRLFDPPFEHQ